MSARQEEVRVEAGCEERGHLLGDREAITGLQHDGLFWLISGSLKRMQRIPVVGSVKGMQTPICLFRNLQVP